MGRKVDVDDLIDTQTVAKVLGLAHRNTVSEYQARYEDMPRPVVELGGGPVELWLALRWSGGPLTITNVLLVGGVLDCQRPSPDGRRRQRSLSPRGGRCLIVRSSGPGDPSLPIWCRPEWASPNRKYPAGGDHGASDRRADHRPLRPLNQPDEGPRQRRAQEASRCHRPAGRDVHKSRTTLSTAAFPIRGQRP